jgi:hypothetical protein
VVSQRLRATQRSQQSTHYSHRVSGALSRFFTCCGSVRRRKAPTTRDNGGHLAMCLARSAASHTVAGDTAVGAPDDSLCSSSSAPSAAEPWSAAARRSRGDPPSLDAARRRPSRVSSRRPAGAGTVARGVLALDGSLLPPGVISVPTSRSERHRCCPYASTASTRLVSVSPSSGCAPHL